MKTSQRLAIQRWLAQGHSLTVAMAVKKFRCYALSQRIREVKRYINVRTDMIRVGTSRVARYRAAR